MEGLSDSLQVKLQLALRRLKGLIETVLEHDWQFELLATAPRYRNPFQALTCYKGIKRIFALTMIKEICEVKRFSHPRNLMSWLGMD